MRLLHAAAHEAGAGIDTIRAIENLTGTALDGALIGNELTNVVWAGIATMCWLAVQGPTHMTVARGSTRQATRQHQRV